MSDSSKPPCDSHGTARTGAQLAARGLIPADRIAEVDAVRRTFAVAVPPHLAALMAGGSRESGAAGESGESGEPGESGGPRDPIARQFVPSRDELIIGDEELGDPIGDGRFSPVPGVVHRYPDRVLFKPVHVCPVYCRFCFRREQVGDGEVMSETDIAAALDYIHGRPEIWEVILSGGDPLVLSNRRLDALLGALDRIDHVDVLRIHTRYPIADPDRVDRALAETLRRRAAVYVVLHTNHVRELTPQALAACATLIDHGVPVLSQTVLLRGVNDNADDLARLMRALVRARIKPYYLHHADLARGTGHFRTTIAAGQDLMRQLRGRLSGLCQPTYVLDIPGGNGKVPIGPGYLERSGDGYVAVDYQGQRHAYPGE